MRVLWIVGMALCLASLPLRGRVGLSVWLGERRCLWGFGSMSEDRRQGGDHRGC